MTTQTLFIEGLPGSGKSTSARIITEILKEAGIPCIFYPEDQVDHPIDFDGISYLSTPHFNSIIENHPHSKKLLLDNSEAFYNGYLLSTRNLFDTPLINEPFFKDIQANDVYELPVDLHRTLIQLKWEQFFNKLPDTQTIHIFECCLIQNPITFSMIKHKQPLEATIGAIQTLENIALPSNPHLIYIDQQDIHASFSKAIKERPKEWFESFSHYYLNQAYSTDHNIEDIFELLERRNQAERHIYDALKIHRIRIDNTNFNSCLHYDVLRKYLLEIVA